MLGPLSSLQVKSVFFPDPEIGVLISIASKVPHLGVIFNTSIPLILVVSLVSLSQLFLLDGSVTFDASVQARNKSVKTNRVPHVYSMSSKVNGVIVLAGNPSTSLHPSIGLEEIKLLSASRTSNVPKNAKVFLNEPVLLLIDNSKGKSLGGPPISHLKQSSTCNLASTTSKSFEVHLSSGGRGILVCP